MNKILFLILLLVYYFKVPAQADSVFIIKEVISTKQLADKAFGSVKKQDVLFEDESYIVRKTCSGEWGGSIIFKNKRSRKEYACEATCPVMVNKMDGKYIVTSNLRHLIGFSSVMEIDDPKAMKLFRPRSYGNKTIYVGDNESKSQGKW